VHGGYEVFLGLDVGKGDHHAVGLTPDGTRLHDAPLANTEAKLRQLFDKLARHCRVLVVVDQPASIGALPVAVARACGHQVAYLPGLAMRRIADLHPGNAKTDARDAYVIADAARTLPHTLRRVDTGDETLAELQVLVGYDDDLAGEATRLANRIRGLLTQIHPPLERALGPKIQHPAVLELLSRCGGPAGLRAAGRRQLTTIALTRAPRMGARLVEAVLAALDEQTVTVPAPPQPRRSCPDWPTRCQTCCANATTWQVRSKGCSMTTLLSRS
jgi:transposase